MSDREIYCEDCGVHLGVIRDARLRKDLILMCSRCYGVPEAQPEPPKNKNKVDPAVESLMNMFGMRR